MGLIVSKIVLAAYTKMKLLLTLTLVLATAVVVYSADSSSSGSSSSSSSSSDSSSSGSSSSTAAAEVPDKCPEVTKTTKYKPKTSETANVAACNKYYICRKGQKDYAPTLRSAGENTSTTLNQHVRRPPPQVALINTNTIAGTGGDTDTGGNWVNYSFMCCTSFNRLFGYEFKFH